MEIWKTIKDCPNYEVSNLGNVKSLSRFVNGKHNNLKKVNESILKLELTYQGYNRVCLYNNKKRTRFQVHQLVALAFIPNSENKLCVNHIDLDKQNNNVNNLEWVTYRENTHHYQNKIGNENIGISYVKGMNMFQASIYVNGEKIYIGSFKKKEAAINAYNKIKITIN